LQFGDFFGVKHARIRIYRAIMPSHCGRPSLTNAGNCRHH
jgi:hypothetical protein